MASYESTYPVYYRGTVNIGEDLSVTELERIARGGHKKNTTRAAIKTQSPLKANMRKSATQATARRQSNIIAKLAFTGLSLASLLAVPKLFLQSGPNKTGAEVTANYVSIPQAYVSKNTKTKGASPTIHDQVLQAQRIVNAPMTDAERRAQPFVDRMLVNPKLMGIIYSVSATTNTPVSILMEVIAAETGGRSDNPLQVTSLQFPQLLGTFGQTYATKMEAYAATLPNNNAQLIRAQATELQFVSQFMKYKEDQIHFEMRSDLYKEYMHKTLGKKAKFSSLEQRVEALYQNEYIRTGMQALSNNADRTTVMRLLGDRDPREVFGTNAIFRLINYFGISRVKHFSEISHLENLPVIGNLMDEATARANHVDYDIKKQEVVIKFRGHVRHEMRWIKTPRTIGYLKKTQLESWDGIEEGIKGQLSRKEAAQRILTLQRPHPGS